MSSLHLHDWLDLQSCHAKLISEEDQAAPLVAQDCTNYCLYMWVSDVILEAGSVCTTLQSRPRIWNMGSNSKLVAAAG